MKANTAAIRILVLTLVAVGCGGDRGPATPSPAGEPANAIVMQDFSFDPEALSFTTGTTATLDNQGAALHNLLVEGTDIDIDVGAGDTAPVSLDLAPGEYRMVCKYHLAQNMVGTITITS
jgi:plastocyanin